MNYFYALNNVTSIFAGSFKISLCVLVLTYQLQIAAIVKINSVARLIKIKSRPLWVRTMFSWALKFTNSVIELFLPPELLGFPQVYDTVLYPGLCGRDNADVWQNFNRDSQVLKHIKICANVL